MHARMLQMQYVLLYDRLIGRLTLLEECIKRPRVPG